MADTVASVTGGTPCAVDESSCTFALRLKVSFLGALSFGIIAKRD